METMEKFIMHEYIKHFHFVSLSLLKGNQDFQEEIINRIRFYINELVASCLAIISTAR